MPRLSCGSREIPRHHTKPGRSACLSEVCFFPPATPSSLCFPQALTLTPAFHLCLAGVDGNGKSPSKSELHRLYLTEKYVWRWKQFLSRRGKRTTPLDLKLGHNNWLRQVRPLTGPLRVPSAFHALLCFPSTLVTSLHQQGQVTVELSSPLLHPTLFPQTSKLEHVIEPGATR